MIKYHESHQHYHAALHPNLSLPALQQANSIFLMVSLNVSLITISQFLKLVHKQIQNIRLGLPNLEIKIIWKLIVA